MVTQLHITPTSEEAAMRVRIRKSPTTDKWHVSFHIINRWVRAWNGFNTHQEALDAVSNTFYPHQVTIEENDNV
jgi:hypothetical protein